MQPDEYGLKIEQIESGSIGMDWLTLEMETCPQTISNILDMQRESGDGDSGAECKEGKDFLEIKETLTSITREVQGAEKSKEQKKISRIPVRQKTKNLDTSKDKNKTQIVDNIQTEKNMEEVILENGFIKELQPNNEDTVENLAIELGDIYRDLVTVPSGINQESEDSSLSPRAPLATAEEEGTLSDDLTMEDEENILEYKQENLHDKTDFLEEIGLQKETNDPQKKTVIHQEAPNLQDEIILQEESDLLKDKVNQKVPIFQEEIFLNLNGKTAIQEDKNFQKAAIQKVPTLQEDTNLQNTVIQEDKNLQKTVIQEMSILETMTRLEDTNLQKTVIQENKNLQKIVIQESPNLQEEINLQEDTNFQKTVIQELPNLQEEMNFQEDTHFQERVIHEDKNLQETVIQKMEILQREMNLQEDTNLQKTVIQKVPIFQKEMSLQEDTNLQKTVIQKMPSFQEEMSLQEDINLQETVFQKIPNFQEEMSLQENTNLQKIVMQEIPTLQEEIILNLQKETVTQEMPILQEEITLQEETSLQNETDILKIPILQEEITLQEETNLQKKVIEETILEAPVEFRCESNKISGLNVCLSSAHNTKRDRSSPTPEVTNNENNKESSILGTERVTEIRQPPSDNFKAGILSGSYARVSKAAEKQHEGTGEDIRAAMNEVLSSAGKDVGGMGPTRPCDAQRTLAAAVAAVQASIASRDAVSAPATRSSRVSAVTVCAATRVTSSQHRGFDFQNGRLVFTAPPPAEEDCISKSASPLPLEVDSVGEDLESERFVTKNAFPQPGEPLEVNSVDKDLKSDFQNGRFVTKDAFPPPGEPLEVNLVREDLESERFVTKNAFPQPGEPFEVNSVGKDLKSDFQNERFVLKNAFPRPGESLEVNSVEKYFDSSSQNERFILKNSFPRPGELLEVNSVGKDLRSERFVTKNAFSQPGEPSEVKSVEKYFDSNSQDEQFILKNAFPQPGEPLEVNSVDKFNSQAKNAFPPGNQEVKSAVQDTCDQDECDNASLQPLRSRDINRRSSDTGSRLKLLESKLKEAAGLHDKTIVLDKNENECVSSPDVVDRAENHPDESDGDCDYLEITELGSASDLDAFLDDRFGGRCEFDVKQIGAFSGYGEDSEFYLVYDELEDDYDEMRGEQIEGEAPRKRHNPDHDNLKSLLKKPDRNKQKKNRVSFNENRNEFFDADYIILIREDCDYDEDDDDGVCTCNQHEMVRLTCCEPGCSCGYDEVQSAAPSGGPTPQSPKFAPPLEFVDSVTLSPPEGYKDMDLGEQQLIALQQMARHRQHQPVCRECSGVHDSDSNSGSDQEEPQYIEKPQERISSDEYQQSQNEQEEKEKTDQSQQTTPTTPPADCPPVQSRYIMETITMTTVTERRLVREVEDNSPGVESAPSPSPSVQSAGGGSPISGILKGGKLWKQTQGGPGEPPAIIKGSDNMQVSDSSNITSDEEGNTLSRRSVRFHESESEQRDSCDGEADKGISPEESEKKPDEIIIQEPDDNQNQKETDNCNNSVSPDATEMMLTFKLGHHVLISNNSLRPNSAVRQLFPCSKPLVGRTEEDGAVHQYLVTAESLKAFEEAKRSKLPNIMDGDDSIRRTIERNTLRRSLIRYEPRSKKQQQKSDNSLVERIKQLTCDVDEPPLEDEIPPRGSPQGEESTKPSDTINQLNNRIHQDKSFSPSSSSTTSSNSSMSSTYKKITDLFGKREKPAAVSDAQNNAINDSKQSLLQPAPDLGNGGSEFIEPQQCAVSKINATSEARKQFLSTLAPLTACVSSNAAVDEFQYQYQLANQPGERASVASTAGTEYSLEDIDEALKNDAEDSKKVAPDVLVGTPSASESTDELAMFVQQDAGRIERIKKRYQPENHTEEDDEHDDYGFNRRPSVRGIKPRFGSTTEILQQIQNQLQPPGNAQPTTQRQVNHVWPYYSETGLENAKTRTCPQGFNHQQYPYPDDLKARTIGQQQYRPTSLIEENIYQNCPNQRCTQLHYGPNVNHVHAAPVMRIGGGCSELYQTLPARRSSTRPESPPPMELSRSFHQTMVLIPYNRIEGFQSGNVSPNPLYQSPDQCNYARFANQKFPLPNKRYPEPVYQGTLPARVNHPPHMDDPQYQLKIGQKQMIRVPYTTGQPVQVHLMASRSESPLPGQFATARATQTPSATLSTCNFYNPGPPNTRYRPAVGPVNGAWHSENPYGSKINRHSFPTGGPRYPMADNISLADSDSQHSAQLPNGYRQPPIETSFPATRDTSAPGSPTKTRFTERGVPEGAASVSPQDSTSNMTSPTSPQNPAGQNTNGKSLYYAMNV